MSKTGNSRVSAESQTRKASFITTNFRKNFIWNTLGTTIFAFTSLIFMMVATRLNGIDDAGIFSFAFSTATVFLVIGNYSGRTFQITDKNHRTTDSDYFSLKFVTCAAMLVVGLVFCLLRGYSSDKFLIIMLLVTFRAFEAFEESVYAVVQKQNRLYQVGQSFFLKAVAMLAGFIALDYFTRNLALACGAVVIAQILTIVCFDLPRLRRAGFHFEGFRSEKVWYLLKIGFFTFGFSLLNIYIINAARYVLDSTTSDSAQTIYGIVAMPATMLSLIGQYLIQPFLTSFKKLFGTNLREFRNLTIKLCLMVVLAGIVCLLLAYLLGIPVLELLYAIDLGGYQSSLILIILGGIFSALILVVSTALITMRHTSDQFWIYCVASVAALVISWLLVPQSGVFGACLSYMLSMALLFVMYIGAFCYRLHKLKFNSAQEVQHVLHE